ncbi:hypothetical protein KKD03_03095 [Patescibacteria group bacterium]|nr:hypothetical protein [Patescibacteria group bacterium]
MTDTAQAQPVLQDSAGTTQIANVSDDQNQVKGDLNSFGEILDEMGVVAPQAVPIAIEQSTETLNPVNPTRIAKEKLISSATLDSAPIDDGGGVALVEHEKMPEIPVEVESFLHRVEDHQDQAPREIVVADGTVETSKANYPSTPVVVLPITQEEEKQGQKKSFKFSFRWLIEWSHKVIKLFAGKAIYKE